MVENVNFTTLVTDEHEPLLGRRIVVTAYAPELGLDRAEVASWSLKPCHEALAERLARAIEAGVVLKATAVKHDTHGKSYLVTSSAVLGRTLHADLRRLGF